MTGKITKGLRIIEAEAEWVRRVFDSCIDGMSLNGIAQMLNDNKVAK